MQSHLAPPEWREHCRALLLGPNSSLIKELVEAGVATFHEIAEHLQMPPEELIKIMASGGPHEDDNTLAIRFGYEKGGGKVRILRDTAKQRLIKVLKGSIYEHRRSDSDF